MVAAGLSCVTALVGGALSGQATSAVLSNVALPVDQHGVPLITGEASAMVHNGSYWVSFRISRTKQWDSHALIMITRRGEGGENGLG